MSGLRAAGDYLGVGHAGFVSTLRVVRDPTCGDAAGRVLSERDQ